MIITEKSSYFIHALMLAAGQSKRFESPKQLALINNMPMVVHSALMMQQANINRMNVVTGAKSKEVEQVLETLNLSSRELSVITSIYAENWQQGMGASIAAGVKNISNEVTHVFVGLADQVEVSVNQYNIMINASQRDPSKIVAAFYNQQLGAPAIFPRAHFESLAKLDNDEGARRILRANKNDIIAIDLPEAAKDIDTKLDLQSYTSNTYKGIEHD